MLQDRELPQGTVTLLFTDIEGSTRLLQELGRDLYVRALTEHRRLLREAFIAHGGVEVEMQGDSFHFAFPFARDAVAAAVAGQRALAEHEWATAPIRVRIGLHTGEPVQVDGLYAGIDVHQAARVMDAGHGGEILVSSTTGKLVTAELDNGVALVELGEHRLKDLAAPERLYRVVADGLPSDFPPPRTSRRGRIRLPPAPNRLIGREQDLTEIGSLLGRDDVRILTLTGPGGSGKSRLALQAAAEAAPLFPDGVVWVPLAAIAEVEGVLASLVRALDAREQPGEPVDLTLRKQLFNRRLLIVFDNFEHVLEASSLVHDLVRDADGVRILITSRERLHLSTEHEHEVRPLDTDAARALFEQRAAQLRRPPVGAAATLDEICDRLDGLPLAIELAAGLTKLLTPEQILHRLSHRFDVLTSTTSDLPARQRTLRATIEWSYELLNSAQQALLTRLGAFVGSFDVAAAEAIADASIDTLIGLVDKSMLRRTDDGRLSLLESIREFALERLQDDDVLRAHAEYYARIGTDAADRYVRTGDPHAAEVLEYELSNLRAAASFEPGSRTAAAAAAAVAVCALARGAYDDARLLVDRNLAAADDGRGDPQLWLRAAHLALAQGRYKDALGLSDRGRVAAEATADDVSVAELLILQGWLWHHLDQLDRAEDLAHDASTRAALAGLDDVVADAIGLRAANALQSGREEEARVLTARGLASARELRHRPLTIERLLDLAQIERRGGAYGEAVRVSEEALEHAAGDPEANMKALQSVALSLRLAGHCDRAYLCAAESLKQAEELGHERGVAQATYALGTIERDRGNHHVALELLLRSLRLAEDMADRLGIATIVEQIASILTDGGAVGALRLLTAADRIRTEIDAPRSAATTAEVQPTLQRLRDVLASTFDRIVADAAAGDPYRVVRAETERLLDGVRQE